MRWLSKLRVYLIQRKTRKAITDRLKPCRAGQPCTHACKRCHDFGLLYAEGPYPLGEFEGRRLSPCASCAAGRHMDHMQQMMDKGLIAFPKGCGRCRHGVLRRWRMQNPLWDQVCSCPAGMWLRGLVMGAPREVQHSYQRDA